MKILMVTFLLPNPKAFNGAAQVVHGQVTALSQRHELTLVTFSVAEPSDRAALEQLRASGVTVHEVGGLLPVGMIRLKRRWEQKLRQLRGGRPLALNFTDPRMQQLIDQLLDEQRFDLLQVENIGLGRYRYKTVLPSVLSEHEVGRCLSTDGHDWERHQQSLWRQFDRIQVFTSRDALEVRRVAPELADRVRVNPFGIDIPVDVNPPIEEPGTVVFVGGFNHSPNVDAAIWLAYDIMPILRTLFSGVRLNIVGSYPPKVVRDLAGNDIKVIASVPAVEPHIQRAAVVLAPLRSGGGMRVKVLQAMALGKAVVTTPLGAEGLTNTSGKPPVAIASGAEEFANATATLLATDRTRLTLGHRARDFVTKHHSWPTYRQRLEKTYAELLGERSQQLCPLS
jgi:glycosyltransferase involved in cell wall biosynthesis